MGNFQKVTVGGGSISVGGLDLGFLKGDIKLTLGRETLELRTGVPRRFQGSVVTQLIHRIEAPTVQLDADTLSKASGFTPVTTVAGTPVTVADAANQERTFAAYGGGAVEVITLDGPSVTGLVVTSVDELTTYTVNDDYILDATTGLVYRNPGGTIASGATVRVHYGYTPAASKRLNIGAAWQIFTLTDVLFTHTRPNGTNFTAYMPKAQASGNVELSFNTEANDFVMSNFVCEALDDASHPEAPLGYWNDEQ